MLFSSAEFLFLFLPAVLLLYYLVKPWRAIQNAVLLVMSLLFYAWGEPKFVFALIGTILANWIFGLLVDRFRERKGLAKGIVALTAAADIGFLFVFKYLGFSAGILNQIFPGMVQVPQIALPIGISFFIFREISYVVDVYRGTAGCQKNPAKLALYVAFFPELVAGPIVRYTTVEGEIDGRRETWEDFSWGARRFLEGMCKKVLISNTLANVADYAFGLTGTADLTMGLAWLGAVAYTFQIYFDFSGYSDMAIGLGRMFGFHFLENFDRPYISRSVTEFWRRWHISMGSWFRDYLYIPLGGNRVSRGRHLFNMFVVWLATGIWHGANWTFIVWGLFYFVILAVEKETGLAKKLGAGKGPKPGRAVSAAGHLYTMLFVILGWVIFRADSLGQAWQYFAAMFGANGVSMGAKAWFYLREYAPELIAGVLVSGTLLQRLGQKKGMQTVYAAALVLLFLASVAYVVKGSYSPFIYLNF